MCQLLTGCSEQQCGFSWENPTTTMDTTAPRGGTVVMSDSSRLKPHGVPTSHLVAGPRERVRTQPAATLKRLYKSPKAHEEQRVHLPTQCGDLT
ncbi:jg2203 [Pararge aegeria aegeria]|uniref:Jg2203 protein n=1 Tax=Pararge aegeria aegeria TaxID=348720 RepID=A0A8S4QW82_9NEOP|nr:jg2203 [Pararge aegeria aegeria]